MRFTQAWANLAHSNSLLKIIAIILSAFSLLMGILCIYLATTPPLLVERGCHSSVIESADTKHTEKEIKAFLIDAIKARFNTIEENLNLLSVKELKKRSVEKVALAKQGISQKVLTSHESINLEGSEATIDTDRLLAVKNIRSAFVFKLKVNFATTKRSTANPYGLILTKVDPIEPPRQKEDKGK